MQLKVVKADGSVERYLHTRVIGTIGNALAESGEPDTYVAEQLAEAVTYFLYHQQGRHSVTSSEIFSIVKAVLAATGYNRAAVVLSERHYERKLKRSRIDIVRVDIKDLSDAERFGRTNGSAEKYRWNKSVIVKDLTDKHGIPRQTARVIASMVEEKVFNIGLTVIPASLIKQLVLGDAAAVLRAQEQLQGA